ncbi:MAG: transketolase [Chthonomonadales bacterium]|nr:transketolase [Chthonomonadales bacterium]
MESSEHQQLARRIRRHVLRMTHDARSSHCGTGLSMAEILAVVYGGALRCTPATVESPERDRLVLSKGHGCAALYAVLAERGFFPRDWLDSFYQDGARLAGHATHTSAPGIEVSTGSLGHGLGIACGMALAGKRDGRDYRVFTILSDGECDEGSIWEAALFAPHHGLDNLVVIVDYNKIQSLGHVRDVLDLEPFAAKWRAFGWSTRELDGHDVAALGSALADLPYETGRPSCLVAHTVKGKGISFMEDTVLWHYRSPNDDELALGLAELGGAG